MVEIVDVVVAAATGNVLEVEELKVQSSQALPFSDGQAMLVGLYVIGEVVEIVDVVTALTYNEVEVEVDDVNVQSSQALPFSDGQAKLVGL